MLSLCAKNGEEITSFFRARVKLRVRSWSKLKEVVSVVSVLSVVSPEKGVGIAD